MEEQIFSYHNYVSKRIKGSWYILPFGENIAKHKKSVKINETGYLIWQCICQGKTKQQTVSYLACYYQITDPAEIVKMQEDVSAFLQTLAKEEIWQPLAYHLDEETQFFKTGDLVIGISGYVQGFETYFQDFACAKTNEISLYIQVLEEDPSKIKSSETEHQKRLIHTTELLLQESQTGYSVCSSAMGELYEMQMDQEATWARIYVKNKTEDAIEQIYHMIRFVFLLSAQRAGYFVLHSASVLYKEKLWLFTGHSGAGKSTHTNLWNQYFQTPRINGDLNMIKETESGYVVYAQPWCGTSQICIPHNYPLGGIIQIKQSPMNKVKSCNAEEAMRIVMQRLISPTWKLEQLLANAQFADQISEVIPVMELECTKEREAADTMKAYMDDILSE